MNKVSSSIFILLLLTLVVIGGTVYLFTFNRELKNKIATKLSNYQQMSAKCSDPRAKALAKKGGFTPIQDCSVDKFTINNEGYSLIEIVYGEGMDCPAGCIYEYQTYLIRNPDQIIRTFPMFYETPDLSLGSKDNNCRYHWTSHLGALIKSDPDHIKRSLIKDENSLRWQFDLNGFTGKPSSERSDVPRCERTGTVTLDLDNKNPKVIGTPEFKCFSFYGELACEGTTTNSE